MGMLDHWQPVALARELGRKPLAVTVAGVPVALFRTAAGIGAVSDKCPHRRLKLSAGEVVGGKLRCQYHGWTFDACGSGESPGSPKLTACTTSYDTREEHGLVWLKTRDSYPAFPVLDVAGYVPIGTLGHHVPAPLELVVDNFNEIEHSATVHANFGYDLNRMHEVRVRVDTTGDSVRVVNEGPTKRLPLLDRLLVGVGRNDRFHDDWTTWFSPVHSVFNHWWTAPDGRERMVRWRVYVFYVPVDDHATRLFSLAFAKSGWPLLPGGGLPLTRWYVRRKVDAELRADADTLAHLADHRTGIAGLKLSRFDKVLGLTRERIARIYRGERSPGVRLGSG